MIIFHFDGHSDWIDCISSPKYSPPIIGEKFFCAKWNEEVMVVEITSDKTEAWVEKYNKVECQKLKVKP